MIQWAAEPVPEVGSMSRLTAKTRMPTIATQKSGALAPASDTRLAKRSNRLPGLDAASDPTTSARANARVIAITASFSVCGKASSATSIADRFWRSDSPKSR